MSIRHFPLAYRETAMLEFSLLKNKFIAQKIKTNGIKSRFIEVSYSDKLANMKYGSYALGINGGKVYQTYFQMEPIPFKLEEKALQDLLNSDNIRDRGLRAKKKNNDNDGWPLEEIDKLQDKRSIY
jgi:hypothetical protein